MKSLRILGVALADPSYGEAVDAIRQMLRGDAAQQVVLANAHALNLACEDPSYRARLQSAALVLRDGIGVKLASVLARRPFGHNFVGTDFVPQLLGDLAAHGVRVFLFGARPGVAAAAAEELRRRHPGLLVVGAVDGFAPRSAWPTTVLATISTAKADILLVALGNPLQEIWIADNLASLSVRVAIGVGALFDYLAGEVPRAPGWMRRLGCEWIYRLVVEPARLWRRYLLGNPLFVYRIVRERLRMSDVSSFSIPRGT